MGRFQAAMQCVALSPGNPSARLASQEYAAQSTACRLHPSVVQHVHKSMHMYAPAVLAYQDYATQNALLEHAESMALW